MSFTIDIWILIAKSRGGFDSVTEHPIPNNELENWYSKLNANRFRTMYMLVTEISVRFDRIFG